MEAASPTPTPYSSPTFTLSQTGKLYSGHQDFCFHTGQVHQDTLLLYHITLETSCLATGAKLVKVISLEKP